VPQTWHGTSYISGYMKLKVKKQPGLKTYGIYNGDKILEGGFFDRERAEDTLQDWRRDLAADAYEPRDDVYDHMSARDKEINDRLDYASRVESAGDPERAAEIRMGA
jgi:hypothetical protein